MNHCVLFILPLALGIGHVALAANPDSPSDHYNYDEPENWYMGYPQCGGSRQSPISISATKSIDVFSKPLQFNYYDAAMLQAVELKNSGHSVEFSVPSTVLGNRPYISGGLLDSDYEAEQIHFHWGSATSKGSEHELNGNRYDIEMHILHRNKKYPTVDIAKTFEDGFAVLGVLFKVVHSNIALYTGLNTIFNSLPYVQTFNSSTCTGPLMSLGSLLGTINRQDFYTYQGSLTTPPCSEVVTWIVFDDVLTISSQELPKFWNILDERGQNFNNARPVQDKGFRKVYHRKAALLGCV